MEDRKLSQLVGSLAVASYDGLPANARPVLSCIYSLQSLIVIHDAVHHVFVVVRF